ncbi:hypothetical protein EVAR_10261_1 [Eumeta japonica]|uniref:Uncharacterized protein n=1 Tax=Eumeta variegata TaxID=151549 RepID=A0A4C1TGA4_EUMVA|nr:hypothetical protein EVAR_10261_1 [Eumeta japonica]
MSITFKFFDVDESRVRECFLAYKPVTDSSGEGLTGIFLDEIVDKYDIDMNDCRRQGYDNGTNMRLFMFFSNAAKRWEVISKYVKSLTLKNVCDTRWESRVNSLQAVRYQNAEIKNALEEEYQQSSDSVANSELQMQAYLKLFLFERQSYSQRRNKFSTRSKNNKKNDAREIIDFEKPCCSRFLPNDVTLAIESTSASSSNSEASSPVKIPFAPSTKKKRLNLPSLALACDRTAVSDRAAAIIASSVCLNRYLNPDLKKIVDNVIQRNGHFGHLENALIAMLGDDMESILRDIAEQTETIPEFEPIRARKKKKMYSYENEDNAPMDPEILFKINVFYPMLDTTINSIETRFMQLSIINDS